jgi:lysozyme family protein
MPKSPISSRRHLVTSLAALAAVLATPIAARRASAQMKHKRASEELRRLEGLAARLGARPRALEPRAGEAAEIEPDAFRNMKTRLLDLVDQLAELRGAQPRSAMQEASELLAQIHREERSIPSPLERAAVTRPPFESKIKSEYRELYDRCTIKGKYQGAVERDLERAVKNRDRYASVEQRTNVPWYVIGAIHNLEASFNFAAHLHNGDDIRTKTHTEPKGLPKNWEPPKSSKDWEESAYDALRHDGFAGSDDWSLARTLYLLEGYNGWGPRQAHGIHTPYLWSFSEHYATGKYDFDGHWNASLTSDQCGAAVLIKALQSAGHIRPPL